MNHDAHTLREFDAALTSLNTHLLQMAYKAQNALDLAVSGLLQQDEETRTYYQKKFRYVLIDEYQDTNHAQYLLSLIHI